MRLSVICFALLQFCELACAQSFPALINYQGRLTDASGMPLSMGSYGIEFRLWDSPTNTTGLVWGQRQNVSVQANGVFDVILGTPGGSSITNPVAAVNDLIFAFTSGNRFLGLTVVASNGTLISSPAEILPRQALLSVPFAILSRQVADGAITAQQIAPATITSTQIADGSISGLDVAAGTLTANNFSAQLLLDAMIPPGTVQAFAGSNIPAGWLLCDGRLFSSSQYPRLWVAIGTAWGGFDGNFNIPDLRGLFLRGVDNSPASGPSGQDPGANNRVPLKSGGNLGNSVGSFQDHAFANHDHGLGLKASDSSTMVTAQRRLPDFFGDGLGSTPPLRTSFTGGNETRPKNAYVNYIIKY